MSSPALVVDADESGIVAVRDLRVDGDDRNPRFLGCGDGGLDAVHVDGDEHDAVDLLGDVVLDRAVLRARHVVGVEDHELVAAGVRRLLGAVVDLIEEQRLLIDGDERIGASLCTARSRKSQRYGSAAEQCPRDPRHGLSLRGRRCRGTTRPSRRHQNAFCKAI